MENGDLMHKVIGCEHGLEGLSMEQSGTPREREHKMTLTPSGTLSMKNPTWRMGSNNWSTIYMFTKSFPTDSKSLQSLL